jgi:ribosome-interacting GTPase 1
MNKKDSEPKLSYEDVEKIGNRIIDIFKIAPENKIQSSVLFSAISREFNVNDSQVKEVLKHIDDKDKVLIYRSFVNYGDERKTVLTAIFPDGHVAPKANCVITVNNPYEGGIYNFTICLKKEDIDAIASVLSEFGIKSNPVEWIGDVAKEAVKSIMDKRLVDIESGFTMSKDTWDKYNALKKIYQTVRSLNYILQSTLSDFIDEEYRNEVLVKQMLDSIDNETDAKTLQRFRDVVDRRITHLLGGNPVRDINLNPGLAVDVDHLAKVSHGEGSLSEIGHST